MIEVEKKFIVSEKSFHKLLKGAEFVSEKEFKDIYYDAKDHSLTKRDMWLRCRAEKFELKILATRRNENSTDQYIELEDEIRIKKELNITQGGTLGNILGPCGYEPFASIITKRIEYKKMDFTIDIDTMDFGYKVVEIEKMVHAKEELLKASQEIEKFAELHGFGTDKVRSKVIEYIRQKDISHFEILEATWGAKL